FLVERHGLLVGDDLVVGIGLVEGLTAAQLEDLGLGAVQQVGVVSQVEILARGNARQLGVGGAVIVEHLLGEVLDFLGLGLGHRHGGVVNLGDALGGG